MMARTVEATGKGWKGLSLLSALGLIVFVSWSCVQHQEHPGPNQTFAMTVLGSVVCLLLFIFSRIGAWWYHG